jgi:hypothetical protein
VPLRPKGKPAPVLLSAVEELGVGFIAGVASRAISQPLSVITVRLQTEAEGGDDEAGDERDNEKGCVNEQERKSISRGVSSTVKRIYDEQGWEGFWGGQSIFSLLIFKSGMNLRFRVHHHNSTLSNPCNYTISIPTFPATHQSAKPTEADISRHTERTLRVFGSGVLEYCCYFVTLSAHPCKN